jgi:hypothetical protein
MITGSDATGKGQARDPAVVACVVFQTRDPEQLVQLLREALTRIANHAPESSLATPPVPLEARSEDRWLKHPEAAQYLGISTSTLYRYACQQKIESRKLCGRLEYRRSILEAFKDLQIRPASHWPTSGSIIRPALGSGK